MPAEPLREQIKAAMAARLAQIVAGSDYWSAPALVTRSLLMIDQYKDFPVLGVVRSSGSLFEQVIQEEDSTRPEDAFQDHLRVAIWGYVKGDLTIIADTRLERLWKDTVRCLLADATLGGLVMELRPDGPADTDDGALEPLGFFMQTWLAVR